MPSNEQQAATEQLHANQLAAAQRAYKIKQETEAQVAEVKKPSGIGYGILFFLAVVLDIIDVIQFTGIGIVVSIIIQVFAFILFTAIAFFVNKKIKRMKSASDVLGKNITAISHRVLQFRQRYAQALRLSRKVKVLRKPVRALALGAKKARGVIGRNPMVKNILANVLEFIPFVGVLPWQTIGVYLMYRDHKNTYREALAVVEDHEQARGEEAQETQQEIAQEYEDSIAA